MLVRPQIGPLDCSEWQAEGVVVFVDSLETRAKTVGMMRAIRCLTAEMTDL